MARNGIWSHREVVDWGSDEEEMPPLRRQRSHFPTLLVCKGGDVLALPCMRISVDTVRTRLEEFRAPRFTEIHPAQSFLSPRPFYSIKAHFHCRGQE